MSAMQTRKWIAFFQAAGIHDDVLAARYAAIFVENEIHASMLNELDMELLRVMGISKVGHVLGILKHAKLVHDTQLFADSQPSPLSCSQSSGSSSPVVLNTSAKKARPATTAGESRIIEHYVRKPKSNVDLPGRPAVLDRVGIASKKPRPKVTGMLPSDRLVSDKINSSSYRLGNLSEDKKSTVPYRVGMESRATQSAESGREVPVTSQRTKLMSRLGSSVAVEKPTAVSQPPKRKRQITVKPDEIVEEVPTVKRPRRVLPEHEGGYNISMPSGSTPRSREILAKMAARQSKTVFDRLGDAAVSSTTEVEDPTITITGFGTQIVKPGTSGSVFDRLGGKAEANSPGLPQPTIRPAVKGIKARLGKQVNFKATSLQNHKINNQPKNVISIPRKMGNSFRSETVPSSTTHTDEKSYSGVLKRQFTVRKTPILQDRLGAAPTHTDEMPYSGVLKKQFTVHKTPISQTRLGTASKVTTYPTGIESSAKRNSSAGILGNPVNATKLSAKARLDLSARPPVRSDTRSRTRKFIMTNRKTGVQTIVYKIAQE